MEPSSKTSSPIGTFLLAGSREPEGVAAALLNIAHRLAGGAHAAYRNAVKAGANYVTGHTHSRDIYRVTSLRGTVWGVDCGCVADVSPPLFANYTEAGPSDWSVSCSVLNWASGGMSAARVAASRQRKQRLRRRHSLLPWQVAQSLRGAR